MPLTLDSTQQQQGMSAPAVDAFDAAPMPAAPIQQTTDAWDSVPDPAPAQPVAQPAAPRRQTLFPEDEGYLRDRDAWVEERMVNHWGGNVLRSPILREKAQQWANIQHFDEIATLNPINAKFYTQRADLTPQRAYDWFKNAPENINTGPALEKQRDHWRERYPVHRYVQLRDQQANKIADAYVMSEMSKSAVGTNDERRAVRSYVLQQLESKGWRVRGDAGLPPVALERYENPVEPEWNSAIPQWLSEGVYAPVKGAVQGTAKVGFGLGELANSGVAVAADAMGYENVADRARMGAQAYGPAREAMDAFLPATKMQREHPYTLGLLETAGAVAPQVLVGWVTGPAAPLMMNAASVGGDVYHNSYQLAIQQGYSPEQANQLAFTTGSLTAAASAAIDRFGPLQRVLRGNGEGQSLMRRWAMGTITGAGTGAGMAAVQEAAPYLAQLKPMERKQLMESLENVKVAAFHGGALGGTMEAAWGKRPTAKTDAGQPGERPSAQVVDLDAELAAHRGDVPTSPPADSGMSAQDRAAHINELNKMLPEGLPQNPTLEQKAAWLELERLQTQAEAALGPDRLPTQQASALTPEDRIARIRELDLQLQQNPGDKVALAERDRQLAEAENARLDAEATGNEPPAKSASTETAPKPAPQAAEPAAPTTPELDVDPVDVLTSADMADKAQRDYVVEVMRAFQSKEGGIDAEKFRKAVAAGKFPRPPQPAPKPAPQPPVEAKTETPAPKDEPTPAPAVQLDEPSQTALESLRTHIPDAEPVEPSVGVHRAITEAADRTGKRVVVVKSGKRFRGVVHEDHPDVLFVHEANRDPAQLREVLAHELVDSLDADTKDALRGTIDPAERKAGEAEYRKMYADAFGEEAAAKLTPERLADEALALNLGRTFTAPHNWRKLVKAKPEAINAVNDAIGTLYNKVGGRESRVAALLRAPDSAVSQAKPQPGPSGRLAELPIGEVHADPQRFQYKNGTDRSGASDLLKGVSSFDRDRAGTIAVWKDPADGKVYVVNGHHRLDLARRAGEKTIDVKFIDAADASEARRKGALINIGEGRGTATDAAKVFRESGIKTEDDAKAQNLSLKESKVHDGLALAGLSDKLFRLVATGELPESRGVAIGESVKDHAAQEALYSLIKRRGDGLSNDQIRELGRFAESAPVTQENRGGLFGDDWVTQNHLLEKARLSDWIKRTIRTDQKAFGSAARNASRLERAGNKIDADASREVAQGAAEASYVYDKLSIAKGPVADALNDGARRMAEGEKFEAVRDEAYQKVVEALKESSPKLRYLPDDNGNWTDAQLAAALKDLTRGTTPKRPDLSQRVKTTQGRRAYSVIDDIRQRAGLPGSRPDAQVKADAAKLVALGDEFVDAMIERAKQGHGFNDAETRAVRDLVDSRLDGAIAAGDDARIAKLGNLILADRAAGSEQGRAFRQRRDPLSPLTPAQRVKKALREALAVDDTALEPPAKPEGDGEGKDGRTPPRLMDEQQAAENGRKLRQHLKDAGFDLTDLENIDPDTASRIVREIQSKRASRLDALYEYWINAILSGPQTHVFNSLSNAANIGYQFGLVRPVEAVVNSAILRDPAGAHVGELPRLAKGILPGLQKAAAHFWRSFKTERATFDESITGEDATKMEHRRFSIGERPRVLGFDLSKIGIRGSRVRTFTRLLNAADQFAKALSGTVEVQARAFRKGKAAGLDGAKLEDFIAQQIADPHSESWQQAWDFASEVTFTRPPGEFIQGILSARDHVKGARWVVPFINTPANIVRTGLRYTPANTPRTAWRLGRTAYEAATGKPITADRAKLAQHSAEQVLGYAAILAFASGVGGNSPWITGSQQPFKDRAKREEQLRTAPPMSIRIGGKWYSYAKIEPFATGLAAVVNAVEEMQAARNGKDAERALGDFLTKNLGQLKDKTFLRGIGDIMDALEGGDKVVTYATNFGVSFIPNLIRQPLSAADSHQRENRKLDDAGGIGDKIKRKALPGLLAVPQPKVNLWGEEVKKGPGLTPATDVVLRILGVQANDANSSKLDRLILAWNTQHPDQPFHPMAPEPYLRVQGKDRVMDQREYHAYLRAAGRVSARRLEAQRGLNVEHPTERDIQFMQKTVEATRDAARNAIRRAIIARDRGDVRSCEATLDHLEKIADQHAPKGR